MREKGRFLCQEVMGLAHQVEKGVAAEDGVIEDGQQEGIQVLEARVFGHPAERQYHTRAEFLVTKQSALNVMRKWCEIGQSILTIEME